MDKARELGRSLLSMATSGSAKEAKGKGVDKRRSWSDVVSSSPPLSRSPSADARKDTRATAGMPRSSSTANKRLGAEASPRRGSSPKLFSAEDVAKLVEIARNQLRKEKENSSGWREVESRDLRSKEKTYVRELVDGYHGSPEDQFRCWQCDKPGNKSSDCPKWERCFTCNS